MAFTPRFPMFGHGMGYGAPQQIFFNPMIARGSPATISAPPQTTNKPPQTSLFVGNISEKCTNEFIQQMLEECGTVSNWKRIKGSNGKYQAFGFCDFEDAEGTLRALRVLHDFQIGDKKLNLKADDKVKDSLRDYWTKKKAAEGKSPGKLGSNGLPADEEALKVDEEVRLKILNHIEKDHPDLLIVTEDGELSDKERKDDRRKRDEERSKKDRRRRSRTRSRSQRRSRRSRSPKHKKRRRHSSSSSASRSSRSRSSSRSSRSRSPAEERSRRKSKSHSRGRDSEDSDTAQERKRLKKELKQKEQNYVNRLKKWEQRERRMAKNYEKEETKEQQRRRDVQKEAKKLRHFLEDYDDERDDMKYYRSGCLFQRKREFEKEKEQDAKDRQRELQEIDDIKKKLLAENKDLENVEEEAKKRHFQMEQEALRKLRDNSGSPNPHKPLKDVSDESSDSSGSDSDDEEEDNKEKVKENGGGSRGEGTPIPISGNTSTVVSESKWKVAGEAASSPSGIVVAGCSSSPIVKSRSPVQSRPDLSQRLNGVFGMDDDEDVGRKKLKPFEITKEERMQALTTEERKSMVKQLIAGIPTSKDALFAYKIDWNFVDKPLIESRVRPWVTKKITEYIGEEEKTLVDFVCERVTNKTQPDKLLQDIAVILDDEAEVFVVKMWRLLIFESEAKKAGLQPDKTAK